MRKPHLVYFEKEDVLHLLVNEGPEAQLGTAGIIVLLTLAAVWPSAVRAESHLSRPAVPLGASNVPTPVPREVCGRVVDPDGRPAAGARVGLNGSGSQAIFRNGTIHLGADYLRGERIVATDTQGWFRFADKASEPFYVLAAHEGGFALVSGKEFKDKQEVRLKRWGRIEGRLARGWGGSDHRVWMRALPNHMGLRQQNAYLYDTPCGADGYFVFEKVPAGWFEVGYLLAIGDEFEGFTARTPVAVRAGETTRVKVGGQGRPVVGRFVPPPCYRKPVYFGKGRRALLRIEEIGCSPEQWRQQASQYDPYTLATGFRTPDYFLSADNRELWGRYERWDDRDHRDDAIWSDGNWRGYAFPIHPDGSFRIDDVSPGTYDLRVTLSDRKANSVSDEPFAKYRATIEVPPTTEPATNQRFDLGTLTLDVYGVGEMAPLFEAETISGERIRLLDFRGKFVLLSFWSTTARAYPVSDLDRLKELDETYGANGHLQVLGINQSDSLKTVRQCIAEHKIEWPQIHSDAGWGQGIPGLYGVPNLPWFVLVDPEGKIACAGVRGRERLTSAVREAMAP